MPLIERSITVIERLIVDLGPFIFYIDRLRLLMDVTWIINQSINQSIIVVGLMRHFHQFTGYLLNLTWSFVI